MADQRKDDKKKNLTEEELEQVSGAGGFPSVPATRKEGEGPSLSENSPPRSPGSRRGPFSDG